MDREPRQDRGVDRAPAPEVAVVVLARSGGDGVPIVAVSGDADVASATALESGIVAALATDHVPAVAVDLREVGFMDTSGAAALLRALAQLSTGRPVVTIRDASRSARLAIDFVLANLDGEPPFRLRHEDGTPATDDSGRQGSSPR